MLAVASRLARCCGRYDAAAWRTAGVMALQGDRSRAVAWRILRTESRADGQGIAIAELYLRAVGQKGHLGVREINY